METRFVYRKDKETIFFNIQLDVRMYKSTGLKIKSNQWGKGFPKKVAVTSDVRRLLDKWKVTIDNFLTDFVEKNNRKPTTNETSLFIDNLIKGKSIKESGNVGNLIDVFIEEQKIELHPNTMRYKKIHLRHFRELTKSDRLTLIDLSDEVLNRYRKNLISEGRENTTTNHYLKTVKSFLNWLYKRKYMSVNLSPELVKLKEAQKDVIALVDEEVEILENANLPVHLQNQVDIFLFGCYTALGIQDLKRVRKEMIQGDFLVLSRGKTGKNLEIPLITEAINILKKHNYNLPCISDNKGNEHLKVAFKKLGLDRNVRITSRRNNTYKDIYKPLYEEISWHKSRKTAITTAIRKGIPIPLVMELSGHSRYETMKRYIDTAKHQLKDLMDSRVSKTNHLRVDESDSNENKAV